MNKKYNMKDLFFNNKFVIVFSLVISVVIWLIVAVELSPEVEITKKNIPVSLDFSKVKSTLGLEAYGNTDFTVNVSISGKRYIVDSDDIIDDLKITANTSYINSPGEYTLQLDCSSSSSRPNYTITSLSVDSVKLYFDYPKEEEFILTPDIEFGESALLGNYILGDYIFQETSTIKVSGPETEINKIEKIKAFATVDDVLTKNTTVEAMIYPVTRDGSTLEYSSYNYQNQSVHITIPVYKVKELSPSVSFKGKPSDFISDVPFEITINPSVAQFGVSEDKSDSESTAIEIYSIDFSQIKPGKNVFTIQADSISNCVVLDETKEFTITVNVNSMSSKNIDAPVSASIINFTGDYSATLTSFDFKQLTVIGNPEDLANISSENINLVIDFSNVKVDKEGNYTVPVKLNSHNCWLYGEYKASVKVS